MSQDRLTLTRRFFRRYKRLPTFGEMMDLWGVKSKATVQHQLKNWIKDGYIFKNESGYVPGRGFFRTPHLGRVIAGVPENPEEDRELISLDERLLDDPEKFLLTVRGDSMIDAGIQEGDVVVVKRAKLPKTGDVVVAKIDGEYTLKRIILDADVRLHAENPKYQDLVPREELQISGVVTAVVRELV